MSRELKVLEDKVLEAAQNCPNAREALKTLFPDVFENQDRYKIGALIQWDNDVWVNLGKDPAAYVYALQRGLYAQKYGPNAYFLLNTKTGTAGYVTDFGNAKLIKLTK